MKDIRKELTVHKRCERILDRSEEEADMPATYYTLDEIASEMNSAPLKLSDAISKITSSGFKASTTSLNPSGFRTDCEIDEIIKIFSAK
jgi:tRNA (guanine26-N2/guanine27-N2)-dimethyltransferase